MLTERSVPRGAAGKVEGINGNVATRLVKTAGAARGQKFWRWRSFDSVSDLQSERLKETRKKSKNW